MELTRNTLVHVKVEPSKDSATAVTLRTAGHWNISNDVSESRLFATLNKLSSSNALEDTCSVVERNYMGEWNDDHITEYVFACGDPEERFVFFFDNTPKPSTCPFCGRPLKEG